MATIAAVPVSQQTQLTPGQALKIAWAAWMTMLALPALVFLAVLWRFLDDESMPADPAMAQRWFLACMGYLALAVSTGALRPSWVVKAVNATGRGV